MNILFSNNIIIQFLLKKTNNEEISLICHMLSCSASFFAFTACKAASIIFIATTLTTRKIPFILLIKKKRIKNFIFPG